MVQAAGYIPERDTAARLAFAAAAGSAVLLFVDVQNDYFDRDRLRVRGASEKACTYMPRIGARIGRFANAAGRNAGLSGIWAVHTLNRQLHAVRHSEIALRSEIATTAPASHKVMAKNAFCAFRDTKLAETISADGKSATIIMSGGIFEDCIAATTTTALVKYGHNVVLVPDLIAARGGLSDGHIRARITEGLPAFTTGGAWYGALGARAVLNILGQSRPS